MKNIGKQPYTWVKLSNIVSAARLDCFYVSDNIKNIILHSTIFLQLFLITSYLQLTAVWKSELIRAAIAVLM